MKPLTDANGPLDKGADLEDKMLTAMLEQAKAAQTYWVGLCRSVCDFMAPSLLALSSLSEIEKENLENLPIQDLPHEYPRFQETLLRMSERAFSGALKTMTDFHLQRLNEAFDAWTNTIFSREGEDLASYMTRQANTLNLLVHKFPLPMCWAPTSWPFCPERTGVLCTVLPIRGFPPISAW
jgi:hypothetical protein